MNGIIENFLIVGLQAGILAVVTMLFRVVLKKTSKIFVYAMWLVLLMRLCIPITTESRWGALDRKDEAAITEDMSSEEEYWQDRYQGDWNNSTTDKIPVKPVSLKEQLNKWDNVQNEEKIKETFPVIELSKEEIVLLVWLGGVVILTGIAFVQFLKVKRSTKLAINTEDNVWETDDINTAFVMGIIKAKIYLPMGLSTSEREFILKHERMHIKHKDNITRLVMLLVNIIYWWNPFVWIAVWLMKKDIEMLCDEAVVSELSDKERKCYLNILLNNSAKNSGIIPMMGFGASNTKKRITHILNLKKTGASALFVMICFCFICFVGCTTVAKHQGMSDGGNMEEVTTQELTTEQETITIHIDEAESITHTPVYVLKEGVYAPDNPDSTMFIYIDTYGAQIWDTSRFDRGQAPEYYVGRTEYSYYVKEWNNNYAEILGITALSDTVIEYNGEQYTYQRANLYEDRDDYVINYTGYPQYDEIIDKLTQVRIWGTPGYTMIENYGFSRIWCYSSTFYHGGFYLIDLDNNGTPELLLGENGQQAWAGTIYEVYTIKNGEAVKLLNGGERYNSLLCTDNTICFESSSSAFNSEWGFYRVVNGELVLEAGVIFNNNISSGDPDNPWNLCQGELTINNSVKITDEEARGIINSYTTIPIEFTLFCEPKFNK